MFSEDDLPPISALQHLPFGKRQRAIIGVVRRRRENGLAMRSLGRRIAARERIAKFKVIDEGSKRLGRS